MTDYGVTPGGFVRKRLATILAAARAEFEGVVGGTLGYIFNGLVSATQAEAANLWEMGEQLAAGFSRESSSGVMLEHGCAWTGTYRDLGSRTRGTATFTGPVGTAIALGSEVRASSKDKRFRTTQDATIPISGSIDVPIECTEIGANIIEAGEIDDVIDALIGVTVTNAVKLTTGRNKQTDDELKASQRVRLSPSGGSSAPTLAQELAEIDQIEQVRVFDNKTGTTNAQGLPAGAVMPVLYPETTDTTVLDAMADVIIRRMAAGGYIYGDENRTVVDDDGYDQLYFWSWATVTDVYIDVVRTKQASYPADGDEQVVDVLAALNQVIGGTIRPHELECDVSHMVPGFSTLEVRVSTTTPPTTSDTSNITALPTEIYRIQAANIRVIDP